MRSDHISLTHYALQIALNPYNAQCRVLTHPHPTPPLPAPQIPSPYNSKCLRSSMAVVTHSLLPCNTLQTCTFFLNVGRLLFLSSSPYLYPKTRLQLCSGTVAHRLPFEPFLFHWIFFKLIVLVDRSTFDNAWRNNKCFSNLLFIAEMQFIFFCSICAWFCYYYLLQAST